MHKRRIFFILSFIVLFSSTVFAQSRPVFEQHKDTLLAQFDIKGDLDDIHAIAAVGSMLNSGGEFEGVIKRTYGVQGSVERTTGKQYQVPELMTAAFGPKNEKWFDALADYQHAVNSIAKRVVSGLKAGHNTGKVWVVEAGQSAFSHDWLQKVINENNGITAEITKQRVIVVQHSWYNEEKSNQTKLAWLKKNSHYVTVDDGNAPYGKGKTDRGPNTARLQGRKTEVGFTAGDGKWLRAARSNNNQKIAARKLWIMADDFIKALPSIHGKVHQQGGTDYSDMVEALWIFSLNDNIDTNTKFWQRFVTTVAVE